MKAPSAKRLLMILLPAASVLVATAVVAVLYPVRIPSLTRDTSTVAGVNPFTGVLSNLGILLWCVAASTCAFAAVVLRSVGSRRNYLFLLSSAILSAYLMFDDLFQFHESLAPRFLLLNEEVIYVLIGIAAVAYLISFRKTILQTNVTILVLALIFLSLSVVVDAILEPWLGKLGDWEYFFEDGAKWLGIVFWCSYHLGSSFQLVQGVAGSPNDVTQSNDHAPRHT